MAEIRRFRLLNFAKLAHLALVAWFALQIPDMASKRQGKTSKMVRSTDVAVYALPSREAAWMFMRLCEAAGLSAGFPSLRSHDIRSPEARTVQVGIRFSTCREKADTLASDAPVVEYHFAGSEVAA